MCLAVIFPAAALADNRVVAEPDAQEVKIPLVVDLTDSIAGVQFGFSYSDGLIFTDYERSVAVIAGSMTPSIEKDGVTYMGFFEGANVFAPQGGKLDLGYLVFAYTESSDQSVTITEVMLVTLGDGSTSDVKLHPGTITVSRTGSSTGVSLSPGAVQTPTQEPPTEEPDSGSSFPWWIIVAAVVVVAAVIALLVTNQKKKKKDAPEAIVEPELADLPETPDSDDLPDWVESLVVDESPDTDEPTDAEDK